LDQELDDADKDPMLGLDQQMEIDRMVMEALGRSNELQRTTKLALHRHEGDILGDGIGVDGEHYGEENN
jgi:hypothetical protein